jgi:putative transposase
MPFRISYKNYTLGLMKDDRFPKRRTPRMKTHDYSESRFYFLTVCTTSRKDIFTCPDYAALALDVILKYAKKLLMDVHCLCVMPDHIHLLLVPVGEMPVDKFIGVIKGRISRLLGKTICKGKIWQASFYDHILRQWEEPIDSVRYILENPVRKGLVTRFTDYKWSWDKYGFCNSER